MTYLPISVNQGKSLQLHHTYHDLNTHNFTKSSAENMVPSVISYRDKSVCVPKCYGVLGYLMKRENRRTELLMM